MRAGKYFANLCHNCRGCYYACQYAPPHEFDLNYPEVMAKLRRETYEEFAWPRFLAPALRSNGLYVFGVSLLFVLVFLVGALLANGSKAFFTAYTGEGSFYEIIPYGLMLVLFGAAFLFGLVALYKGVKTFWKETAAKPDEMWRIANHVQAIKDTLTLRYLDGNGEGCNYPDDRFSMIRRKFHHATFYGFMACVVSTAIAFIYDHIFGWPAPYEFFSLPVLFGTGGGIALCIGTGGLMYLKCKMDRRPYDEASISMDVSFAMLLFLICLTGLLLMLLHTTALMGLLLCIHLGLVLGLFVTFSTSKFAHIAYRYFALVRNAYEMRDSN